MKNLFLATSCILMSSAASLQGAFYEKSSGYTYSYQPLVYDDFLLHLHTPAWQPRAYYCGILPSSIGYFYVNNWDATIGVFGSNRYVEKDDVEAFYESLLPLEDNLLPYATPVAGSQMDCQVVSVEDAIISNRPAKKVVFELEMPNQKSEMVVSYIFTKPKTSFFSSGVVGYTYSISCYKDKYDSAQDTISTIVKSLEVK